MRYIIGILMALVAMVGTSLAAESSAVDNYMAPPVTNGTDLKATGYLSASGNDADGYPYQFFANGTMFINEKIFGGAQPVRVVVKEIFDAFPEVKTVVLQADGGMEFNRGFTTVSVLGTPTSNGNFLMKPIHSFDQSPAPGDLEATWQPSI
jgi:hypothetical protein